MLNPKKPLRQSQRLDFRARRGLAPLEMVLWLPILLFVTALMVNMGTSQAWRVRGEIAARDAVWRTRWPRQGSLEPRPPQQVWPQNATYATQASATQLATVQDPTIQQEVAYGPMNPVNVRQLLRYDTGMQEGLASITRPFPMLPKLGGLESGTILHPLLTGEWQNAEMNWLDEKGNQGYLPANTYRRIKALYALPEQDPSLAQAFYNALQDLFQTPNYDALNVLDHDDEFYQYTGNYPDFHPRIRRRCELDPEVVKELEVERIIDEVLPSGQTELGEISCLPNRLTSAFLGMYRNQINELKALLQSGSSNAGIQAQIDALQAKVDQLEAYQKTLPRGC